MTALVLPLLVLLDVSPVGVFLPIALVALLIAIPVLVAVYFLVRALRRMLRERRGQ